MDLQASPSTKSYAANKGVDLEELARKTGRTTLGREDVDAHLGGQAPAPAAWPARTRRATGTWTMPRMAP